MTRAVSQTASVSGGRACLPPHFAKGEKWHGATAQQFAPRGVPDANTLSWEKRQQAGKNDNFVQCCHLTMPVRPRLKVRPMATGTTPRDTIATLLKRHRGRI
jgi:hypothetical protein